jgi:ribosome biogenesis GTPase / thiamine phosphate phosphatase
MKGIVYKSTGSWYLVKGEDGHVYQARLKGKFKIKGITSTNPIAVGDEVGFEMEDEAENRTMITALVPRRNYVNRISPANRRQHHIIASNLDQSLLIATIKDPRTSTGFIDRFLVTCEAFHIPAIIVFNKSDLHEEHETTVYEERKAIYEKVGYRVLLTSVEEEKGLDVLKETLYGKTTLISGHSGVGKSSIINAILEGVNIRTTEVSDWSGKGMHTTTFAEMYDIPEGGRIIDTPGMREFAIADITKDEFSHFFPEMKSRLNGCHFNNCMHLNEPDCAIKKAVLAGEIHEDRYISYCTILDSMADKEW